MLRTYGAEHEHHRCGGVSTIGVHGLMFYYFLLRGGYALSEKKHITKYKR